MSYLKIKTCIIVKIYTTEFQVLCTSTFVYNYIFKIKNFNNLVFLFVFYTLGTILKGRFLSHLFIKGMYLYSISLIVQQPVYLDTGHYDTKLQMRVSNHNKNMKQTCAGC